MESTNETKPADSGKKAGKKSGLIIFLVVLALLVVAGIGGGIYYVNSPGYNFRKNVELAVQEATQMNYESAVNYYQTALSYKEDSETADVLRDTYIEWAREEKSRMGLKEALTILDKAESYFGDTKKIDEERECWYLEMFDQALEEGMYEQAEECIQFISQINHSSDLDVLTEKMHVKWALKCVLENKYEDALSHADLAGASDDADQIRCVSYTAMGDEAQNQRDYVKAMELYSAALEYAAADDKQKDTLENKIEEVRRITDRSEDSEQEVKIINVWSFTDEVQSMIVKYRETHPDFNYIINYTIIPTVDGMYQPSLDVALVAGGLDAPDIYAVDSSFALKYLQGDFSSFAATYKSLGIDVDNLVSEGQIAQYSVDLGTRPWDGEIVGLGYASNGGCFIYRRSIAKEVWGTDDPEEIQKKIGGATGSWDDFLAAAEELKEKGYAMVSGNGDVWRAVENSADQGWVVDGKLNIDPKREAFLDLAKTMTDNDYSNGTEEWDEDWFTDMNGTGKRKVFGFFGPAWVINDSMDYNAEKTKGDWAVCTPPCGFWRGGTWLVANKDSKNKKAIGDILEWLTLDTSEEGLQYALANGTFYESGSKKDTVASTAVMEKSDGSLKFLGGQNMYEYYTKANALAKGTNSSVYDEICNSYWCEVVREYTGGTMTRDQAIASFKQRMKEQFSIEAN